MNRQSGANPHHINITEDFGGLHQKQNHPPTCTEQIGKKQNLNRKETTNLYRANR